MVGSVVVLMVTHYNDMVEVTVITSNPTYMAEPYCRCCGGPPSVA